MGHYPGSCDLEEGHELPGDDPLSCSADFLPALLVSWDPLPPRPPALISCLGWDLGWGWGFLTEPADYWKMVGVRMERAGTVGGQMKEL